jgi:hypothetical protein
VGLGWASVVVWRSRLGAGCLKGELYGLSKATASTCGTAMTAIVVQRPGRARLCASHCRSLHMTRSAAGDPSGRLNVLANVVRKPLAQIFSEFTGKMHEAHEVRRAGPGLGGRRKGDGGGAGLQRAAGGRP